MKIVLPFIAIFFVACLFHGDNRIHCLIAAAILLSILGGGILTQFVVGAALSKQFSVLVGEKGITGYSFWGRKITLSWAEIETVELIRDLNFLYLKISSFRKDRPVMCHPVFLRKLAQL